MVVFVRYEEEKSYLDPKNPNVLKKFPSLFDQPSLTLSVIVPAKDEEKRLPKMLDDCLHYLEQKQQQQQKLNKNKSSPLADFSYEVIVVDDGSSDRTVDVALSYSRKMTPEKVRVLKLRHNRGKGGAVRLGFWVARGRYVLFADADGATKFEDFEKLYKEMQILQRQKSVTEKDNGSINGGRTDDDDDNEESIVKADLAVVVGSRAHLETDSVAKRSIFRTILMFGFHFMVWLFCVKTVRDTQCGFKMFTRDAARILFSNLHIEKWAFDVELLFLAEKLHIPIKEVAVNWREIEGSKLSPLLASLQMARDLFMIWLKYFFGYWSIETTVLKHED